MANQNLSPHQFGNVVPIKEILNFGSGDAYSSRLPRGGKMKPGTLVKHSMRQKNKEVNTLPQYHELKEAMRTQGQTQSISAGKDNKGKPHLIDGHHRVAIAQQLGWTHMLVEPYRPKF